ncbi:glycoside hydrolase family 31 protein [Lyngbya confervoides]|uniref:Glycoside hydrolase family 31 N-terminal domain-containing protein n=1 Tax=Lyngbya confervoides BDU141951 TaxID=1574623 RepID=A0ABD4SZR9_9CYAN|nr:TIM-barrel domain-containing protein [Lyngbya confervoides]MCM1981625.1 hypothetical protein [Lyngbya confervoides BDU141951]
MKHRAGLLQISNGIMTVELHLDPFRWSVRNSVGQITAREQAGGLFYTRLNPGEDTPSTFSVLKVTDYQRVGEGVDLQVLTEEGKTARVRLRLSSSQGLEIQFLPPDPDSLLEVGDRLISPENEAIYGLTERLQDSPLLSETPPFNLVPQIPDIPVQDVFPGFPNGPKGFPFPAPIGPVIWGAEVGSLNRRGETVEMKIYPTFSLYTPFYQSSRDYGLHVEGTTFGEFDIANSNPGELRFNFERGSQPGLTFHVFTAPSPLQILDEYTQRTGRPFVPPDWAFLNWRWRDELSTEVPLKAMDINGNGEMDPEEETRLVNATFAEDIENFDQFEIPPGVYLFDRPVLEGNYGFGSWQWDEGRMGDIDAIFEALEAREYRTIIWSSTLMCGANGAEALWRGYLAPGAPGLPLCSDVQIPFLSPNFVLDVTNPAARDWWKHRISSFLTEWGIDGIKLDRGEENIPSTLSDIWADGRTGAEVRNDYPNLQALLHHEALEDAHPDGDFVLISRAGYSGTQEYSVFWGGDTAGSALFGLGDGTDLGLRSAIIAQQRAAYMGMPIWGSDTGGYYEFKDREVFARWIEFSAFSGIMEIGGQGTHAPWDMPTEPNFDEAMIEIYRRYTTLRQTLLPYIVSAAQEAEKGVPLVRPMAIAYPQVPEVRDKWDQYLFGPDLLVAPVWKIGERSREVYLPSGQWRNYWNPAEVFQGRRSITVEAPLDTIPVFVRAGAEVPFPQSNAASSLNASVHGSHAPVDPDVLESLAALAIEQSNRLASDRGWFQSTASDRLASNQYELVMGTPQADLFIADLEGPFDGYRDVVRTGSGPDEVDAILVALQQAPVGENLIFTGSGDDYVFLGREDLVSTGLGNDALDAVDSLGGNQGKGGSGQDSFYLGHGDVFWGGSGRDRFFVGAGGENILSGGPDGDEFWIANGSIPAAVNTIIDFNFDQGDRVLIAGAESLGIRDLQDITQQIVPGVGLLLSSYGDPLALLHGVNAALDARQIWLQESIV